MFPAAAVLQVWFRDLSVNEALNTLAEFCLEKDEQGSIRLKRDHTLYYQVQMQLFVTEKPYCDFTLWTERENTSPFVEHVTPNRQYFKIMVNSEPEVGNMLVSV
ncbi:hypothetical protein UPYG_G00080290, partial [Umbra pygmaea]